MSKILNFIDILLKRLTIFCIALMLVIVFVQVITRYCFNYTPSFGEELARYLFVWTVFLSLPLLARSGGHMAIETLTNRIHGAKLKACRILADIFSFWFLAIMVWYGGKMVVLAQYQTSPAMLIPMSYVYSVIPFGCFVMLLYTVENFIKVIRTPADEVK
ncbi:TRAP transporter small permease [uncultured Mailhella sp.]|uniref:TRAP transporter small permease n=1 Tax=uncultured Mailhella sp. TaxID=1981031 RepID=UPI00262CCAD0|nr:TRAP transporter small permease [uncultured Mailhella sp.]